ncbi:MAG: hypothetical protein SW019_01945 [Actinomycetota bacterium]|nr:hypothetical protein [Actinomycetota bacterium]
MPDDEQDHRHEPDQDVRHERVFSGYGIASAVLGFVAVVAAVLAVLVWTQHRAHEEELDYRARALQAAAEWTGVLINMSAASVDQDLVTLHEGTVGQLNVDFEATVAPFRRLVQTLDSQTTGLVDSVALETIHHDGPGAPAREPGDDMAGLAERTDTVMVVATSVSENAGSERPQTVRWTLRLDVSEVDGEMLISRLEPIR